MASLVADYGESSGNSDEDDPQTLRTTSYTDGAKPVNFFAEDGQGVSEESDAEADGGGDTTESQADTTHIPKLPNPFLQASSTLPAPLLKTAADENKMTPGASSSVFQNPFELAEQARLGILEKHVRLTEAAPKKPASKQVCFKFKKGLCHLGAKCRFFHDRSNIPLGRDRSAGSEAAAAENDQDSGQAFGRGDGGGQGFGRGDGGGQRFPGRGGGGAFGGGGRGGGRGREGQLYHPAAQFSRGQPSDPNANDEDNYMNSFGRKKRHGVTDYLVPPKKAMTDLDGFRKKERPWTTKK